MEWFTIHCPLGECHGATRLASGSGVYYLEAFTEHPETPVGYREPEPAATVGGEQFVDERHRSERTIECSAGHALRLHLATAAAVDPETCLYGPIESPTVRCPSCAFGFGDDEEFVLSTTAPTERTHELVSVTRTPEGAHTDVADLSRSTLCEHDRLAHRQECPHCGTLVAFNYERR